MASIKDACMLRNKWDRSTLTANNHCNARKVLLISCVSHELMVPHLELLKEGTVSGPLH